MLVNVRVSLNLTNYKNLFSCLFCYSYQVGLFLGLVSATMQRKFAAFCEYFPYIVGLLANTPVGGLLVFCANTLYCIIANIFFELEI